MEKKEPRVKCAICGKDIQKNETTTIRESWMYAGSPSVLPESSIVHFICNLREQALLEHNMIRLVDLYPQFQGQPPSQQTLPQDNPA